MSRTALTLLCLLAFGPAIAQSDTEQATPAAGTEAEADTLAAVDPIVPPRPDDAAGELKPSDGVAECASILAVGSSASMNFVQRKNMENAAGTWFAASGDIASQEGDVPEASVWETKVDSWSGRIGSIDGMAAQADWMAYCTYLGQQHGLDTSHFPVATQ